MDKFYSYLLHTTMFTQLQDYSKTTPPRKRLPRENVFIEI